MKTVIDHTELIRVLNARIEDSNCNALAKNLGFSQAYIYQVSKGEKSASPKLALKLGFKAIAGTYKKL